MGFLNYRIKNSKGVFYTTSKEPMDGYKKNEYEDKKTKETKVSYHLEKPYLKGTLSTINIKKTMFGDKLFIVLKDLEEDDYLILDIPLFNGKEKLSDWVKAIAPFLGSLKYGDELDISLNRKKKDKQGYLYKSMYIKANNDKVDWVFSPKEDVPKWSKVSEVNKITGEEKLVWDSTDADAFYYKKVKEAVDNFMAAKIELKGEWTKEEKPAETTKQENNKKPVPVEVEEEGDLPF